MPANIVLQNAALPAALVADPALFGGRVQGDLLIGDLLLCNGKLTGFLDGVAPADARLRDLRGQTLLPRLTEAHCHLDKCHSIFRLQGVGGDLMAAAEVQQADIAAAGADDIRRRAERGLFELHAAGCGLVRSHVDWGADEGSLETAPPAWQVLGELAEDWADCLTLQRAALISLEHFDRAETCAALARRLARDDAVLGVFVFDQKDKPARLRRVFDLAERHGLALDFHVDEGLQDGLDGLGSIAEIALERDFQGPLLCGHACALMNLDGDALARLLDRVAAARLAVVTLPSTNLYLQGRSPGATPERRGITRLRELRAAGVSLAVGSDNVGDAFCPLGKHDPMANLQLAALTAHLDPPYGPWLPAVTTDARRALGAQAVHLDKATLDDLLLVEATHSAAVVAGAQRRPLSEFLSQEEQV